MTEDFDNRANRPLLTAGEAILWQGKPRRSAFIAARVLTLLPIAVVWLCFDSVFISQVMQGGIVFFLIPFMLLHLMPVWIWLASALTADRRWRNTNYYVTNRRIILQGGFLAVNETSLFYKDLRNVQMRVGLFDKLFHTGSLMLDDGLAVVRNNHQNRGKLMENLENPYEVYRRVQTIILDIQTDMEYPNAFRPAENPGYQTDYQG